MRSVATEDVFERIVGTFHPDVETTEEGISNSPRTFTSNAVVTQQVDGSVRIDDCLFVHPLITAPSVWYSGIVRVADGQWRVEQLTPEFLQGCTPMAMQEAVLAGYEAYWDARLEFWDPPDPEHPLVDSTTTGSFNGFLTELLADDLAKGQALRGRSMNFPEIIEVNSEFQVVIFDCQLQDPERGLFDIETGERLDGIAPIVAGQKDVVRVTMRLVDGVWKVEDVPGQAAAATTVPVAASLVSALGTRRGGSEHHVVVADGVELVPVQPVARVLGRLAGHGGDVPRRPRYRTGNTATSCLPRQDSDTNGAPPLSVVFGAGLWVPCRACCSLQLASGFAAGLLLDPPR